MPTSRQATRSVATHVWRVKKDCSGHTSRGKKFKRRVTPTTRLGPGVLPTDASLLAVTATRRTCPGRWTAVTAVQCEWRTATRSRVRLQLLAADAGEAQRVSKGKPRIMLALGSALQAPSGGPVAREDRTHHRGSDVRAEAELCGGGDERVTRTTFNDPALPSFYYSQRAFVVQPEAPQMKGNIAYSL